MFLLLFVFFLINKKLDKIFKIDFVKLDFKIIFEI